MTTDAQVPKGATPWPHRERIKARMTGPAPRVEETPARPSERRPPPAQGRSVPSVGRGSAFVWHTDVPQSPPPALCLALRPAQRLVLGRIVAVAVAARHGIDTPMHPLDLAPFPF